jgi:hypothetical protein
MELIYILNYIVLVSFIVILLSYLFLFKVYEGFENSVQSDYEKTITNFMTILSESICPATEFSINAILEKSLWIIEEDITKNVMNSCKEDSIKFNNMIDDEDIRSIYVDMADFKFYQYSFKYKIDHKFFFF